MEEDLDFSLESFVEKIELPHRAKVTEGYYEPGDEDGDREFSYGEILHVRRLICPFVDLTFKHPDHGLNSRITISTRNQDVRFRVITEMEALTLDKPRTYNNVREIIEKWPNSIKSLADQFVEVPGSVPYAIVRGDALRLIRVVNNYADSVDVRLELKSSSTKQLIQLPIGFTGSFCEMDDPKSYSLQELVDVARTGGKAELTKEVTLGSLEAETFPFGVEYFNTSEYRNTTDDQLPLNEELTFDRFVKADPCVVVSKLFGDAIGAGFHVPLRTKITIRMERRWKRSTTAPQQMSHLDNCSEQITEGLYNELMGANEYGQIRKKERLPPVAPPRLVQPNAALANRPQPPLPPTAIHRPVIRTRNKNKDGDGDSSDDDYSYIDIESLDPTRPESATEEEIKKGIIEIPVNGNISAFNTYQMVFFLRENHAPMKTLSSWRRQRFDGMDFARMSDDDLKTHGIANPVVQFFRDRSKMQLVLAQL